MKYINAHITNNLATEKKKKLVIHMRKCLTRLLLFRVNRKIGDSLSYTVLHFCLLCCDVRVCAFRTKSMVFFFFNQVHFCYVPFLFLFFSRFLTLKESERYLFWSKQNISISSCCFFFCKLEFYFYLFICCKSFVYFFYFETKTISMEN